VRTALLWRWGLWAQRILQIPLFWNPKGRRLLRVYQFGPQNPAYGVLKSLGTPFRACVRRAFWRYHYHSQELTPRLLELKATGVFTASVLFIVFFSHLRATPVVVGSLAVVPPGAISSVPSLTGKEVTSEG